MVVAPILLLVPTAAALGTLFTLFGDSGVSLLDCLWLAPPLGFAVTAWLAVGIDGARRSWCFLADGEPLPLPELCAQVRVHFPHTSLTCSRVRGLCRCRLFSP